MPNVDSAEKGYALNILQLLFIHLRADPLKPIKLVGNNLRVRPYTRAIKLSSVVY